MKKCSKCGIEKPLSEFYNQKLGKIRGVLCRACNSALGQLGDSIQSLTLAIKYLSHGETKL